MHDTPLPSNRRFGLTFAAILAAIAVYGVFAGQPAIAIVASSAAAVGFLALALFAPHVLAPLNRAWRTLGLLLGKIVNPVVLLIIFLLVVTPVAVIARLLRYDPLRQRPHVGQRSYWRQRLERRPSADSYNNQF